MERKRKAEQQKIMKLKNNERIIVAVTEKSRTLKTEYTTEDNG